MRRATQIIVTGHSWDLEPVYNKYKDYTPRGFKGDCAYTGGCLFLAFEPDSPEIENAIIDIEKFSKFYNLYNIVSYTKSEEDKAPYFKLTLSLPLDNDGTTAKYYGTVYSGGCPVCGQGKKPVGDVLVDRKLVKNSQMASLRPDMVVSEEVRKIIEDNGFTGISFKNNVRDYKGREMKKLYTFEVHNILPPMSDSTWLRNWTSAKLACGHRELVLKSDMQYEAEKLENALDFNLPYEYNDLCRLRYLVISARVRNALLENNIKLRPLQPVLIL